MIAPRLRLVLVMFLVAVPFATAAGLNRGFLPMALLLIGFTLIVVLCDLALGLGRYRHLQFSIPDILHGIRDERVELEVRVRGTVQGNGFVHLAVRFPDGLEPDEEQT
ncbi:MAG TPA: hypothetical protein VK775_21020, partial [Chthoniobacterales bacterium]|nr:hypothetical protein [Chthoniobacterales bacterium]